MNKMVNTKTSKKTTEINSKENEFFIKDIKEFYLEKKEEIHNRLLEFKQLKEEDLFYELCFCTLTPQSNAVKCNACIKELKKHDFMNKNIDPKPFLKTIRFYNNKTRYLLESKSNWTNILKNTQLTSKNAFEKREWIESNVKGMGMKEASHFLRNTGTEGLAILDRHILKNMIKSGIIKKIPQTISIKKYLEIETKFKKFSKKINIPFDNLDLVLWGMNTGFIFK